MRYVTVLLILLSGCSLVGDTSWPRTFHRTYAMDDVHFEPRQAWVQFRIYENGFDIAEHGEVNVFLQKTGETTWTELPVTIGGLRYRRYIFREELLLIFTPNPTVPTAENVPVGRVRIVVHKN